PLPPTALLFLDEDGEPFNGGDHLAERFREDLKLAGVTRPELFERSASRLPIRVHDLRATFITINLANGKTETWITDRTGHKSSGQIYGYKRAARTAAELGLGTLAPLDAALPELAAGSTEPPDGRGEAAPEGSGSGPVAPNGSEPKAARGENPGESR